MGKRARRNGIANMVVRAARASERQHDEDCAAIAQRVYRVGVELKREGFVDEQLPPSVWVPLQAAAEASAVGAAQLAGVPVETEAQAHEVAAYLLAGFRELVVMLDPDHFDRWRAAGEEGGSGATDVHEEGVDRADDGGDGTVV